MVKRTALLCLLSMILGLRAASPEQAAVSNPFHPHRALIKLRAGSVLLLEARAASATIQSPLITSEQLPASALLLRSFLSSYAISSISALKRDASTAPLPGGVERIFAVELDPSVDVMSAIRSMGLDREVEYAEPDFIGYGDGGPYGDRGLSSGPFREATTPSPNDPGFGSQWGLLNVGQSINGFAGKPGADVNALGGWDITTGDSNTILAVLDSGVPLMAQDFSGRLLPGYDFANNDDTPADDYGHGSNVTSVAAATANNSSGIAGMNWQCRILPLKTLDAQNSGLYSWWASALIMAADKGANVINMSEGGSGASTTLSSAVTYAASKGAIVVACMMNTNSEVPFYPAAYSSVIAVGALNNRDQRAVPFCFSGTSGSNFGSHIDFMAPGEMILGLDYRNPGNTSYWCGTSQATPMISGLITLMFAIKPGLTFQQVYDALKAGAEDRVGSGSEDAPGWDKYYGWGRVNAQKALQAVQSSTTPALTLYFPRLVTSDGSAGDIDNSEYTGLAVANLGAGDANLTFTAYDTAGNPLAGTGVNNPKTILLRGGEQAPIVDTQVFGAGLPALSPRGWFKVESSSASIVGFFLMFNASLTTLDGADATSGSMTSFVFPEIEDNGFTLLHVVNPNPESARVTFDLVSTDGNSRASPAVRSVNARGALIQSLAELFPGAAARGADHLRVTASQGVVPFEYLGVTGRFVEGLNGQNATVGAATLYCPQYVVGGRDYRSTLSVVNLDSTAGSVSFQFFGDDGSVIATRDNEPIPARGKIHITDQAFLVNAGSVPVQGYVKITSNGPRLSGNVVFGDPERAKFATALPLASSLKTSMLFGQVASDATYFTGVALLNPGSNPADVTIDVYDAGGTLVVSKAESIGAMRRKSQLLTQYIPGLVGQDRRSGYIKVIANQPITGFALFGTNSLSVLSGIPPQWVP